jgi:hypothetical protein
VQVDVEEEQLFAGELDVMEDADVADVPARPSPPVSCLTLATPSSPLLDEVRRAELQGELLSWLVAAHGDDPLGPEVPGGQHGQ